MIKQLRRSVRKPLLLESFLLAVVEKHCDIEIVTED